MPSLCWQRGSQMDMDIDVRRKMLESLIRTARYAELDTVVKWMFYLACATGSSVTYVYVGFTIILTSDDDPRSIVRNIEREQYRSLRISSI